MPDNLLPQSRCIGWFCGVRDVCARHLPEEQPVIVRWWMPDADKVGLDCPHFVEVKR